MESGAAAEGRNQESGRPTLVPYVCPKDGGSLTLESGDRLACASCGVGYSTNRDGMTHLDVVQSEQAHAFDELAAGQAGLRMEEVESSRRLAARFLELAHRNGARELSSVLDVAAGRGELCIGLLSAPQLAGAEVHAIDHSAGSLRVLTGTASSLGLSSRLRTSVQDVRALAFPPASFDLITGNAVLHHFDDVRKFLGDVARLLRPGGVCVFAEPFAEGYLLAMQILRRAVQTAESRLSVAPVLRKVAEFADRSIPFISKGGLVPAIRERSGLGMYEFIVGNVSERVRNASHPEALATLTDKHFFSVARVVAWASALEMECSFENYEPASYYERFLDDILATYQITNPEVVRVAREMYAGERAFVGEEFPFLYSHFRFITLTRKKS